MEKRREFLKKAAGIIPGAYLALRTGKSLGYSADKPVSKIERQPGKVILSQHASVIGSSRVLDEELLKQMLNASMKELTGEESNLAWKSLFTPEDVVGIKVNCLAGPNLSSHPTLVRMIVDNLMQAGVPGDNIIVWERTGKELKRAGFTLNRQGSAPRYMGTDDPSIGYDPEPTETGTIGSCLSGFLSRTCTALISVPILKDHDLAGVTNSLKNFFGGIHNPNKYHDNHCDPYIGDLNTHPLIRNKLRLVVCDALTVQYHGGPGFKERWATPYGGLLVGQDPVALDRIGAEIIEEKRLQDGLPTLKEAKRPWQYILTAGKKGLGVSEREKINLVKV